MHFAAQFQRQPPAVIMTEAVTLILLVGFLDFATGYEVSLSILYGVPIFAVAWSSDKPRGLLIALVCGIVWWWASIWGGKHYPSTLHEMWETFVRIGFFVFIAIGAASLKREHDAAKSRITLLEHSRRLEREIVEISEREQRRIGRDLHDGLCQYQAALACAAASLNADLSKKALREEAARADELATRLREAVAQTRDLARGLVPVQMEELGLASALQELAGSVSQLHDLDCQLEVRGQPPQIDNTAATHLYRIAQEATNNAIRHGQATRVEISLSTDDEIAVLRITDNGTGFDPTTSATSGMGMGIMKYRAKLAGGELLVEAREEGGASIACVLRIQSWEAHERAA